MGKAMEDLMQDVIERERNESKIEERNEILQKLEAFCMERGKLTMDDISLALGMTAKPHSAQKN